MSDTVMNATSVNVNTTTAGRVRVSGLSALPKALDSFQSLPGKPSHSLAPGPLACLVLIPLLVSLVDLIRGGEGGDYNLRMTNLGSGHSMSAPSLSPPRAQVMPCTFIILTWAISGTRGSSGLGSVRSDEMDRRTWREA